MPYVPAASADPVVNGNALQAAIDAAALGDTITLDPFGLAGRWYQRNFTFPDKGAGRAYITIESTAIGSLPEGVRVKDPRVDASQVGFFARLATATYLPPMTIGVGAHHYHLKGSTSPAPRT